LATQPGYSDPSEKLDYLAYIKRRKNDFDNFDIVEFMDDQTSEGAYIFLP
jgi:hypothetical protein